MCKRYVARRVPPSHSRHPGGQPSQRGARHAAGTRRTARSRGPESHAYRRAARGARSLPASPIASPRDGGPARDPSDHRVPHRPGDRSPVDVSHRHRPTASTGGWSHPETWTSGDADSGADGPVDARTTSVRHVIAQAHRPGDQLCTETLGSRPAVAGTGGRTLDRDRGADDRRTARDRAGRDTGGGGGRIGDGGEHGGVSRTVTTRRHGRQGSG
jgi:hypothetical protein